MKRLNRNYLRKKNHVSDAVGSADKLLFKNGSLIDFSKRQIVPQDMLIVNGVVAEIGHLEIDEFDGHQFDIAGKLIMPGLFDMHVHFREPGREDEETLLSGASSAMFGGFTSVCTMPNTEPATDNREIIEYILNSLSNHLIEVHPIAAITIGRKGEQLVEIAELVDAGVIAFSDDGSSVANPMLLRRALDYSRMFDILIIEHCEEPTLAANGAMHEGFMSTKLGLPGIPSIAEELIVARNIMLARYTNGKIHIAHISTKGSIDLVRRAKAEGIQVTCEVTPHHFSLCDEDLETYDTNLKMNPPLRTPSDVEAVFEGLKDGTIDVIATDHAPHSSEEKDVEFDAAPFGIIGSETAVGLTITKLVKAGKLNLIDALEKLSAKPYQVLGLPVPEIRSGAKATISIIDQDIEWMVDKHAFRSQSRNTPFHGMRLHGKSWGVINNGKYLISAQQ
ncbi:dihydroorotase [candidate division KSB1 bacterium]|nr:dihydroorotase [candidate division KSB1 bacterium]